jgi:hypothetical protein
MRRVHDLPSFSHYPLRPCIVPDLRPRAAVSARNLRAELTLVVTIRLPSRP